MKNTSSLRLLRCTVAWLGSFCFDTSVLRVLHLWTKGNLNRSLDSRFAGKTKHKGL